MYQHPTKFTLISFYIEEITDLYLQIYRLIILIYIVQSIYEIVFGCKLLTYVR